MRLLSPLSIDAFASKIYKKLLQLQNLKSCVHSNKYGFMHYYDSNPLSSERPLVLLHGIGSSGQSMALLALILAEHKRVILPDLFHFCGFSEPNNSSMNLDDHVASIGEFLEFLDCKTVDFCGLSLGGWIGLKLAAIYPHLISTLSLLNPAGLKVGAHDLERQLLFLDWKKFGPMYDNILHAFPYNSFPVVSDFAKQSLFQNLKRDSVKDFVKSIHLKQFAENDLNKIKCPTLVLWGKEDKFLSSKIPIILMKEIENCHASYVKDCAHVLSIESPITVAKELGDFLQLPLSNSKTTSFLSLFFKEHPLERILNEKRFMSEAS